MSTVTFVLTGRGVAEGKIEVESKKCGELSVGELKNLVKAKLEPSAPDFRLVCKGQVLDPSKTLASYNFGFVDGACVKLVLVLDQPHWVKPAATITSSPSNSLCFSTSPSSSSSTINIATNTNTATTSSSSSLATFTFHLTGRGIQDGVFITALREGLTVDALKNLIATALGAEIKCVVCKGQILKPGTTFESYKIDGPTDKIKLVVVAPSLVSSAPSQQTQEQPPPPMDEKESKRERIRRAIAEISQREGSLNYHFELQDQNGRPVHLPEKDRVALVQGMTLHEKGKAALARKDYKDAVEWFTLAEASFANCDPKVVATVDNMAFLCLDLVWTLFLTKELKHLPEAQRWLSKAEDGFHKAHGPNRERLRQVKQGFCPENALYVRLRLLQAVVEYHMGNYGQAKRFLQAAQADLDPMTVRPEELALLMEMGYEEKESRRALRAMGALDGGARDINQAVGYILQKKEEAKRRAEKERKRREDERIQQRFGETRSGKPVNLELLAGLQSMGFTEMQAATALKQTDNNQNAALMALVDPTQKQLIDDEIARQEAKRQRRKDAATGIPAWRTDSTYDEQAMNMAAMGFDPLKAKFALSRCNGNAETALTLLTDGAESLDAAMASEDTNAAMAASGGEEEKNSPTIDEATDASLTNDSPSSSSAPVPPVALSPEEQARQIAHEADMAEKRQKEEERKRKRDEENLRQQQIDQDFLQDMVPDLETDPEAFLDIDLHLEAEAIAEYTAKVLGAP